LRKSWDKGAAITASLLNRHPRIRTHDSAQPETALADALQRQRAMEDDPDGYVFPAIRGKYPHRQEMHVPFRRAVTRAGLDPKKVTPHVMRHTAITRLVQAGTDLPTIQRISGHKTIAMVLHYTHVHGTHIDTALEALNTPFPATVTPELHTPAPTIAGARQGRRRFSR